MRRPRGYWPVLLVLLTALLVTDVQSATFKPYPYQQWGVPGAVLLAAVALTAQRWPTAAGPAAAAVLLGWSSVLHGLGAHLITVLLSAEYAAVIAIVVAVVRTTSVRTAAGVTGALYAAWFGAILLRSDPSVLTPFYLAGSAVSALASTFAPAMAAGWYVRGRDAARVRATRAAVTAARQRERVALARELHDVVAHHVGGIVVQAQAAQVVTGADAARRVLPAIGGAGTEALASMRRMVVVLRAGEAEDEAPIQVSDLTTDLRAVTATPPGGTAVRLTLDLAEPITAEVATSVLRLVQESVTNARRYATGAHEIAVTVRSGGGTARVSIQDDGRPGGGPPRSGGGGFGLIGMRERVQLLGGLFSAGPAPGGGWRVYAEVPLQTSVCSPP